VLAQRSQAPLSNVPYKGGAESLNDVISGTVPAAITALPNLIPMHQAGRLRILAVTADKRLSAIPDVPTFASLGYPEMTASEYMCLVARKGSPAEVFDPLMAAFATAVNARATVAVIEKTGFERASSVGQSATLARLTADSARWKAAVKDSGFRATE
jgi:tripartite-type tricarboxylate transporter receptor subunit TctC